MEKAIKTLIETYIQDIEKDNYINVIAAAAKEGVDCVAELRTTLKNAGIDMNPFDKQFAKMLTTYNEIVKIIKQ